MTQLDLLTAETVRDQAIHQVDVNADEAWKREAKRVLWARIREGGEFTTDDLEGVSEPHEPRAWGAVIRAAARGGWIVNTGRVRVSANPRCHARPKTVWRSTYGGVV